MNNICRTAFLLFFNKKNSVFFLFAFCFLNFPALTQTYKDAQTESIENLQDWCSANASYSTSEMDSEQPFTRCNSSTLRFGKWFKFIATTGSIEIKVKTGNAEGTLKFPYITLREESMNELACVQYSDEMDDIVLNYAELNPGKVYYFSVNNHNHSKYSGSFTLCVTDVESNDFIIGAVKLWSLGQWCSENAEFTSVAGTADGTAPSCIPKGPNFNRWFIFQAINTDIEIKVKSGGPYGTCKFPIIALWDESFKELACNNTWADNSEASVKYSGLKNGNIYYISVDHLYNEKYQGTFTLCANNIGKQISPVENSVSITGKLFTKTGPLVAEKILLMDEKGNILKVSSTDAKGKFRFPDLAPEKVFAVKIESDDNKLGADIFLINSKKDILKKTVRDKQFFRFEELPLNCNLISLIDCQNSDIKIKDGMIGILGKMLSKKDPADAVVRQRVYLLNNPKKIVDSTLTDIFGKFHFLNLPSDQPYLIKMGEPVEENYTEVAMINDKGKAIMTSSSRTMDSKGYFRFEKLPSLEAEPIALQKTEDERMDLSAITDIKQINNNKIITLNNIFFDFNTFKLLENSYAELDRLAKLMIENPSLKIEISGHTDNSGNEATNLILSANRAKAVNDYLISKKVNAARLSHKGSGSSKPIAANDSEENRKKNRRVEFRIIN